MLFFMKITLRYKGLLNLQVMFSYFYDIQYENISRMLIIKRLITDEHDTLKLKLFDML